MAKDVAEFLFLHELRCNAAIPLDQRHHGCQRLRIEDMPELVEGRVASLLGQLGVAHEVANSLVALMISDREDINFVIIHGCVTW